MFALYVFKQKNAVEKKLLKVIDTINLIKKNIFGIELTWKHIHSNGASNGFIILKALNVHPSC